MNGLAAIYDEDGHTIVKGLVAAVRTKNSKMRAKKLRTCPKCETPNRTDRVSCMVCETGESMSENKRGQRLKDIHKYKEQCSKDIGKALCTCPYFKQIEKHTRLNHHVMGEILAKVKDIANDELLRLDLNLHNW